MTVSISKFSNASVESRVCFALVLERLLRPAKKAAKLRPA